MAEYLIVTDVIGCVTLCVPKEIFDEHFTIDGEYAKHKWYGHVFTSVWDDYLNEAWDEFLETYRLDSEKSVIAFGDSLSRVVITHVYRFSS